MPGAPPTSITRRLPAASSLLLDVVRFGAAVMVAVGHITQWHFSVGWPDLTTHAVESVAIFFVLSGFVIRYVTRLKYYRIGEYWIDRASRIYSVVLPAVVFTMFADWVAMRTNPVWFLVHWGRFMNHPVSRLVHNLLFTSQFWSRSATLFSNGPFWSLSYECLYYAIYGCAFYLRGAVRWIAALGLIALGGPHIALLFPLWVLGCVLYEVYSLLSRRTITWRTHLAFAAVGALCVTMWQPAIRTVFALKNACVAAIVARHHQAPNLHWMLDFYRVGLPAAFLLLWLLVAVHGLRVKEHSRTARAIRILAEGTFPLYLIHFPLYILIASVVPYNYANPIAKTAMVLIAIVSGVLLAVPTNRLKDAMRAWLRNWFLPGDRMPTARSAEPVATGM
jgi:peptidoglycan/LPS O-acetylase OafA/YrhL